MNSLPKQLKIDGILEVAFEVRFEADASIIPEIMFGQLATAPAWKDFRPARLPTANIPAPIRRSDPNLMYAPAIELTSQSGEIRFRFGPQVAVYARVGKYPGWDQALGPEIAAAVEHIFHSIPSINVTRLGLRYINALRSDAHDIKKVNDLAIEINVAGEPISDSVNLNFRTNINTDF